MQNVILVLFPFNMTVTLNGSRADKYINLNSMKKSENICTFITHVLHKKCTQNFGWNIPHHDKIDVIILKILTTMFVITKRIDDYELRARILKQAAVA
jgi:hypothetical protein